MAGSAVERVVNGTGPDYEDGIHKDDMMRGGGQHDGALAEAAVSHQINAMSGAFLPFRPPPMPRAPGTHKGSADQAYADAALAAEIRDQRDQQKRVYRAVFTIEESLDSHGEVKILAHSPELIEEPQQEGSGAAAMAVGTAAPEPRTFLGRMALRQMRYEAISVKRQRKLKMKKKKYKKLQKRLRHERRKLDR